MSDPFFTGNVNTHEGLRAGRFWVSAEILRLVLAEASEPEGRPSVWFDQMMHMIGKMVIVSSSYDMSRDVFEYLAVSSLFAPLTKGAQVPLYEITITQHEDGQLIICAAVRAGSKEVHKCRELH